MSYYCRSRLEHTTEAFADLSEKRSCDFPVDSSLNTSKEKSNPDFCKEKTHKNPKSSKAARNFPVTTLEVKASLRSKTRDIKKARKASGLEQKSINYYSDDGEDNDDILCVSSPGNQLHEAFLNSRSTAKKAENYIPCERTRSRGRNVAQFSPIQPVFQHNDNSNSLSSYLNLARGHIPNSSDQDSVNSCSKASERPRRRRDAMPFPPTRIVFQNNECSSLLSSDLNVVKESANQVPINSCSKAKKVEVYIPSERPRRRRDAALFPPTEMVSQNNKSSNLLSSNLNLARGHTPNSSDQDSINSCSKAKRVEEYIASERPRRRKNATLLAPSQIVFQYNGSSNLLLSDLNLSMESTD